MRSGSSGSFSTQPHLVISRLRDNSYSRMTAADVQQIATPQNLGQVITIGTNPQRDCESSTRYRSNSMPGTKIPAIGRRNAQTFEPSNSSARLTYGLLSAN